MISTKKILYILIKDRWFFDCMFRGKKYVTFYETNGTKKQKGGKAVISKLYEQYHKGVYLYIYSLCHDQTLSEDLTSETFYQVMLSLPSFKYNSSIKNLNICDCQKYCL